MIRIKNIQLLFLLFCFCQENLSAQKPERIIDSLLIALRNAEADTARIRILNQLSRQYINTGSNDGGMKNANDAMALANKVLNDEGITAPAIIKTAKREIATANHNIGILHHNQSNYSEALKFHNTALKIQQEIIDQDGILGSYLNIGNIYLALGKYPEALNNYSASLKIAEELKSRPAIARAQANIGIIHHSQGNYSAALNSYSTALKVYEETGDKRSMAILQANIGLIYSAQGNYSEALKRFLIASKINEEIGNRNGLARSYVDIGGIYQFHGNYSEALKKYLLALKIRDEIGDRSGVANCYLNIGNIHGMQDNHTEALNNYMAALKIQHEIGAKYDIIGSEINIGNTYIIKGNYDEALKYYSDALKISEETGDKWNLALSIFNVGRYHEHTGNYDEALKNYQKSLAIREEIGASSVINESYLFIGNVLTKQANVEKTEAGKITKCNEAILNLDKSLLMAKEIGEPYDVMESYKGLADAYKEMNDYMQALKYNNLYVALKDSLLNNDTNRKLEQQRTAFEVEKALSEEKIEREKAVGIEKLKYQFALAKEKSEQDKLFAAQQFDNERKLADVNAKHQQAITDENAKQAVKEAEAKILLEKEKAAKKRRTEAFVAGLMGLALVSIFTVIIIRQRNQKRRAVEKAEVGHKMAELELQSLRAQLNPHFMFNSLNAIQDLIVNENSEKSHLYLARFSKLLRMLLDNANQPFVTVKQELELLELYLSLENLRIPNLQYSIEKDPRLNAEDRMIPNMMLQPYIENAIWHGLSNKKGERKLQIRIHENGSATEFEVEDNGIGRKRSAELKQEFRHGHHSKGMQLLSKRFELLSKEYGTTIQTTITDLENNGHAEGTLVKIDVPFTLSEQAKQLVNDTNHHN